MAPGPIWTPFMTAAGFLKLPLFDQDVPMDRAGPRTPDFGRCFVFFGPDATPQRRHSGERLMKLGPTTLVRLGRIRFLEP